MKSENNKLKFNFRIVKHNFLQLDVSLALCSGSGIPPPPPSLSPTVRSSLTYPTFFPLPICCPRPCQKVVNICSLHATCFAFLCPFAWPPVSSLRLLLLLPLLTAIVVLLLLFLRCYIPLELRVVFLPAASCFEIYGAVVASAAAVDFI